MGYGCQRYDLARPCRYDRRVIDPRCTGCQRTTDLVYLAANGLWKPGVSHREGKVNVAMG